MRTSLQTRERQILIERLAPAVRLFRGAADLQCDYYFAPRRPTEQDPNSKGWTLIRNSMVWQIEAAAKVADFDTAVRIATLATKAGFDLAGGGAADADVGLQFADDARRAIAPHIPYLGTSQLARLTEGMKRALSTLPEFGAIADNEKQNFLSAVDWIQEAYRSDKWDEVDEYLGGSVRDATTYLKQVKKDDRERRPSYFKGFASEAEAVADWHRTQSASPVVKRQGPEKMPLADERPWKRYAASLFSTLAPIQSRYDTTLARTRLMVLTSEIYRQIKVSGVAPKTLDGFSKELATDPYMGTQFKYRVAGSDFRIYSVGLNFKDDLGDTDTIFYSPDLTLETKAG